MTTVTYLALGCNLDGPWGNRDQTLKRALIEIELHGIDLLAVSPIYKSLSLNPGQPDYFNLVVACRTGMAPQQLLRVAKSIERDAGRRVRQKWAARTLDIDVVMTGARLLNWPLRRAGSLTLPHPECHTRAFVLKPLRDISPHWHHAGLRLSATELLRRLPGHVRRSTRRI